MLFSFARLHSIPCFLELGLNKTQDRSTVTWHTSFIYFKCLKIISRKSHKYLATSLDVRDHQDLSHTPCTRVLWLFLWESFSPSRKWYWGGREERKRNRRGSFYCPHTHNSSNEPSSIFTHLCLKKTIIQF